VPLSRPVNVLKLAHEGMFAIENVSAWPFGSEAAGWNEYATFTVAVVDGLPEIVGAPFDEDFTVIENAGKDLVETPSVTRMTMLLNFLLTTDEEGVPFRRPEVVLKDAQPGLFEIENLSVLRSGSEAFGWNE
jgi:hypothetical protein